MRIDGDRLDAVLERATSSGGIPGVVGVAADRDGVIFEAAHGTQDAGTGRPMGLDAIFRITSLTKAVTGIAAMQLVEQGRLDLDQTVASILPAFDDVQVLDGFDGDEPRLRKPARRATVRHLMTHTSGLTYDALHAELLRYGQVTGVPMPASGLRSCFASPLVHDPGAAFAYGMGTDWLGLVIEALTGQPLEDCFRERIFEPLGIHDMTFTLDDEQKRRLVRVHLAEGAGPMRAIDFDFPEQREFDSAGHGLFATAGDYLTIQRLLLHRGTLGDVRLLRAETVDEMSRNQIGDLSIPYIRSARPDFSCDIDLGPDVKWGLETLITTASRPGLRAAGSVGWCGTFNSYYWIDRTTGVTAAVHMQYLPLCDPRALALYESFERALYASL